MLGRATLLQNRTEQNRTEQNRRVSTPFYNFILQYGYDKDVLSLKEFNDCITVDFEGCKFKCLKNYNKYLIKHYGNYMELPPVEKRVTHHYFEVYRILDKNDR